MLNTKLANELIRHTFLAPSPAKDLLAARRLAKLGYLRDCGDGRFLLTERGLHERRECEKGDMVIGERVIPRSIILAIDPRVQ